MTELLTEIARRLSRGARALLLRNGRELEQENQCTRAFIDKFRVANPLRVLHANAYSVEPTNEDSSERRLPHEDGEVLEALRFHFSGSYESSGNRFERWIGPDGCIAFECSASRRFLSVTFDDDHRISMWPDLEDKTRPLFPTTDFMISSTDIPDDYARMLERVSDYVQQTSARPMYRYADPELDLACSRFYLRHQVAISFVTFAMTQRFWGVIGENIPTMADGLMSEEEARTFVIELTCRMAEGYLMPKCRSCQTEVQVAFEDVGGRAHCGACEKPLSPTDFLFRVHDPAGLDRLLGAPLPVVVGFWSAGRWSSVIGMSILHDAVIRNDGKFVAVAIATELDGTKERYGVIETPTYVRFRDGHETGRLVDAPTMDELHAFGIHG